MTLFIEMPDLALEHIIGFLDFRAVDFRNFIDDLKKSKLPDSKFKSINVFLENEERIRLTFMWDYNSQIEINRY
ncbi:hypothetical protein B9Z55_020627 [Caenorhabditis nigoni]|uniref:F-box domain-containing protein n=1 Tax=Caenorhabditis nigoni TaxID=1611254 RepID=A0A2G5TNF5_9PELO|nr:hypothetical protein B9Z55_020627 [Caenorhabditis nigoni]